MSERALFATKLGVLASTVGSAVGLGNIWRFPYMTGQNGGAAFLITYIVCVLILGIPLMISEFVIGRKAKANACRAFQVIAPKSHWNVIGYLSMLSSIIILGFYIVISGWITDYVIQSFGNEFIGKSSVQLSLDFKEFVSNPLRPLIWIFVFLFINYIILSQGVTKGIERASNILMPALFVILSIFCVNSLFMPGAEKGLEYLFKPDFSKITPKVFLSALGQAFFSLSIGLGILITYGSYFKRKTNITSTSFTVAALDVLVAILSGIIIFPAIFSFNISPTEGPELIFVTLPNVLQQMSAPHLWSILFFMLVGVAALTSTISLFEVATAYIHEEFSLSRKRATLLLVSIIAILSTLCSLSFSTLSDFKIFGMTFFDFSDYISANILLPICGFFLAVFVGWKMKKSIIYKELSTKTALPNYLFSIIMFCIRYIAPISIILIFLSTTGIFKI